MFQVLVLHPQVGGRSQRRHARHQHERARNRAAHGLERGWLPDRRLAHLAVPAELRENVEFAYYEAGHMMYLHEPSRLDQSARLAEFVTRA